MRMASAAASICAVDENWADATELLAGAVDLLPLAAHRYRRMTDQEHLLGQFTDLAANAAACSVAAGDRRRAVTLLEAGRGIILSRALQLREGVDHLRVGAPELADRFDHLRAALDTPIPAVAFLDDSGPGRGRVQPRQRRPGLASRTE